MGTIPDNMRVMTVRGPWAWAIIYAGKDIENRQANIAGAYRGPIAIHVGKRIDESVDEPEHPMHGLIYPPCPNHRDPAHNRHFCTWCTHIVPQRHAPLGHIIGIVNLVGVHPGRTVGGCGRLSPRPGVHRELCSPWAEFGAQHLVLANPRPLAEPILYRGMLGLRQIDPETIARIRAVSQ